MNMPRHYVLDAEGEPVPATDVMEWARLFEISEKRIVAQTSFGESQISTVFLGLDHNYSDHGPPLVWETMIFGGPHEGYQDRCGGKRANAIAMHEKAVAIVKAEEDP